jgi:hypothetical protein
VSRTSSFFIALVLLGACTEAPRGAHQALGETEQVPVATPRVDALAPEARAAIDQSRLPILLPSDPAFLRAAIITHGPHFSALSSSHDSITLSVAATDARFENAEEMAPMQPVDQVRGQPATFAVNDMIRTVSWDEAGLAWAVDVECADPERDARCASDDYLRSIVEGLELAGGGP